MNKYYIIIARADNQLVSFGLTAELAWEYAAAKLKTTSRTGLKCCERWRLFDHQASLLPIGTEVTFNRSAGQFFATRYYRVATYRVTPRKRGGGACLKLVDSGYQDRARSYKVFQEGRICSPSTRTAEEKAVTQKLLPALWQAASILDILALEKVMPKAPFRRWISQVNLPAIWAKAKITQLRLVKLQYPERYRQGMRHIKAAVLAKLR